MAKKTKVANPENIVPITAETTTEIVPKPAKVKKVKVEVPLTPAQLAAKQAMEDANKAAREELIASSAAKIAEADKKIDDAKNVLLQAKAERKALDKALGIKGVFGGKKASTLIFASDYSEGKGAPQARAILAIVKSAGEKGMARAEVVKLMTDAIKTNMDRSRLLSYYTSKMVDDKVITIS